LDLILEVFSNLHDRVILWVPATRGAGGNMGGVSRAPERHQGLPLRGGNSRRTQSRGFTWRPRWFSPKPPQKRQGLPVSLPASLALAGDSITQRPSPWWTWPLRRALCSRSEATAQPTRISSSPDLWSNPDANCSPGTWGSRRKVEGDTTGQLLPASHHRWPAISLPHHGITECSGLEGTSVGHPVQPPAQAGSPRAGCTGPCPDRSMRWRNSCWKNLGTPPAGLSRTVWMPKEPGTA